MSSARSIPLIRRMPGKGAVRMAVTTLDNQEAVTPMRGRKGITVFSSRTRVTDDEHMESEVQGGGVLASIASRKTALTVDELAGLLQVSPKSIYKAIRRGSLNAMRICSSLRLDPAAVVAWLGARTIGRAGLRRAA